VQRESGLAQGLLAVLAALSRRRTLGGRTWIALVAFALIGIVTLQLGLLKLNGGIGRALEHEAVLQRENAALSIENSELAAGDRIASWASQQGMVPVATAALHFLKARPGFDPARAAGMLGASIHAPATGSGEAPAGGSSTPTSPSGSAQQSTSTTTASAATSEPSTSGSTTTPASTESSSAGSAPTSPSREVPARGSGEVATTSRESTANPPANGSPSSNEATPGAPAETGPAGGTRASSSG
jgi:cell division protein FtsL